HHIYSATLCSYCHRVPLHLHSFPTRRSSDLHDAECLAHRANFNIDLTVQPEMIDNAASAFAEHAFAVRVVHHEQNVMRVRHFIRSEEHTSELQSRENLVCRLLLEKKKTHTIQ